MDRINENVKTPKVKAALYVYEGDIEYDEEGYIKTKIPSLRNEK